MTDILIWVSQTHLVLGSDNKPILLGVMHMCADVCNLYT